MYREPERDHVLARAEPQQARPSVYDGSVAEQNIPVHSGIGAYDVPELPLAPWRRQTGHIY